MNKLVITPLKKSIFLISLLAMVSCTELVTDRFPTYDAIPTVNAILVAGEPITMHVSLTGGLDSLPLPNVDNAKVELYIDGKYEEQLQCKDKGIYQSASIVKPEKIYRCKLSIPGFDTVFCSQTLPNPARITNVEWIDKAGYDEFGDSYSAINVSFNNNQSNRCYYEITQSKSKVADSSYIPEHLIVYSISIMDIITDPVLLHEGLPFAVFSNESIPDSTYTMTLNRFGNLAVELRSVTYDYYQYQKQYYLSTISNSPIYSNIENGRGIFAGYSVFTSDTITPEPYEVN
jgi:hypothetical protein